MGLCTTRGLRGAQGIIGTNIDDANDVAEGIFEDFCKGKIGHSRSSSDTRRSLEFGEIISNLFSSKGASPLLSYKNWLNIQAHEKKIGKKIVQLQHMYEIATES